jgi:hypothetical protein
LSRCCGAAIQRSDVDNRRSLNSRRSRLRSMSQAGSANRSRVTRRASVGRRRGIRHAWFARARSGRARRPFGYASRGFTPYFS